MKESYRENLASSSGLGEIKGDMLLFSNKVECPLFLSQAEAPLRTQRVRLTTLGPAGVAEVAGSVAEVAGSVAEVARLWPESPKAPNPGPSPGWFFAMSPHATKLSRCDNGNIQNSSDRIKQRPIHS